MTFKLIIEVIGYVNKAHGALACWSGGLESMFTLCKYH